MFAYALRRVIAIVPLIFAVATVTFFLMHSVKGGPFDSDRPLSDATRERLNERYDLDGTLVEQYRHYVWNLLHGNLGVSFSNDREVTDIIGEKFGSVGPNGVHFGPSLQLGISAFTFALVFGLTLGIVSSLNQNGIYDYIGVFLATLGAALPGFILAPFLVILFALPHNNWVFDMNWFDVLGWEMWNYHKMVLPTLSLGFLPAAFIARITRASMLDVLRQDYIRTARAKGVKEYVVVLRHAVKNALIPVLTIAGPIFAGLIVGSFIIERAFQIPGLGRSFVESVINRDYGVIMGTTLFFAVIITFVNLIVDLLYAVVDPRIRL